MTLALDMHVEIGTPSTRKPGAAVPNRMWFVKMKMVSLICFSVSFYLLLNKSLMRGYRFFMHLGSWTRTL